MSVVKERTTIEIQPDNESAPLLIDIGYPLRLTKTGSKIDLTSRITASEFWALQNAWTFIKSRWHRYALELFVEFYTLNHDHINRFRNKKSGKICVIIFSEHAKTVFGFFKEVIENGIKNWGKSVNRINAISRVHVSNGISYFDLSLMAGAFKELILRKCQKISTPTLEIAIDKLCEEVFEQHRAREITDDDVSVEIGE